MSCRVFLLTLTALVLSLSWSGRAAADARGDKIMARMDEVFTGAKDQRFLFAIETHEPGRAVRRMKMRTAIKGKEWRRVDFLEPGDLKGTKVLILSMTKMYVYLPQFRKIRRVASHVRDQGFMGTVYSHDDMSVVTFGDKFTARLASQDKGSWTLNATLRPSEKDFPYKKAVFVISKKYKVPTKIKWFNAKGVNVKTEERGDYKCRGEICTPGYLKLTDHTRNGAWTRFTCEKWEVDVGIPDRFFSPRALKRGG